jgi:hypothetical protein
MKLFKKKPAKESVWNRELIPEDSVWRKELIPEDSIWRKELVSQDSIFGRDLLAFARRKSPCLQCPILMVEEEHICNRFDKIPEDIWDGLEPCPLYEDRRTG